MVGFALGALFVCCHNHDGTPANLFATVQGPVPTI